jgi:two-component system response regulator NreC
MKALGFLVARRTWGRGRKKGGGLSINILIADDHKIMREGLRSLVDSEPDMKVIAEAGDGRMAVQMAREVSPDIALVDIGMPEMNGIDATAEIVSSDPDVKVIALSMHSEDHFVMGMMQAGASGYLLKDCAAKELCSAVRTVISGQTYLSPKVANVVIQDFRREISSAKSAGGSGLTAREQEVLHLVAEGETSRKIARQLDVSIKTIQAHRQKIMDKLEIHSVAGLTKYAIQKGISAL